MKTAWRQKKFILNVILLLFHGGFNFKYYGLHNGGWGVEGFMNDEGDVMWVVNISLPNLFNHLYFSNKKGTNVTRETKKAAIHMYHHFHICPTSQEEEPSLYLATLYMQIWKQFEIFWNPLGAIQQVWPQLRTERGWSIVSMLRKVVNSGQSASMAK